MADRWVDVSSHQVPAKMLWGQWGFPRGQYRLMLGTSRDTAATAHRKAMREAGMLTGSYGVPRETEPIAPQAMRWVDAIPPDDENDDWVDAEREKVTEAMLSAYCDVYDQRGRGRLAIYTGGPWWLSHIPIGRRARYAHYKLIFASYPFDTPAGLPVPMDPVSIALRSTPPADRRPTIPLPWAVEAGWQHSGQGSLPGYDRFLDMGIYMVNPGGPVADPLPALVTGHARSILDLMGG